MTQLLSPLRLRDVTLKHRIVVPPMHQYSAVDGMANDWHFVHAGRLALGGAALLIVEATAVSAQGRATYGDIGLWEDNQVEPLRRLAAFLKRHGCVPGIQLNHAGRKAATQRPWHGMKWLGSEDERLRGEPPWPIVGPTDEPAEDGAIVPRALTVEDLRGIVGEWSSAARRAADAGFEVLELHGAHGYLLHSFLSPLSNRRSDAYGGGFTGRVRFVLEVVKAVRAVWPERLPLFYRTSAVDGQEEGLRIEDTVELARELKACGVDVLDCSSGGIGAGGARIPRGPGFQVPFAQRVRIETGLPTMAVGLITDPAQAAAIIDEGKADLVAVGRQCLEDANWPLHAVRQLAPGRGYADWPEPAGWWLARRRM